MPSLIPRTFALCLLGLAACPADDDDPDASSSGSTTAPGSTGTDPTTSSSTSAPTTTDGLSPEEFCAQFERNDCGSFDGGEESFCGWVEITPVSIEADACVLGDVVGRCVPVDGNSTADGCGPPAGCEGEPFQIDLDGQLGAFFQCGGSAPIGSSPCTYVEPGVFEPAECGCICDEPSGGSSSGGGSSSSTGG